jgi:hypothetical protein
MGAPHGPGSVVEDVLDVVDVLEVVNVLDETPVTLVVELPTTVELVELLELLDVDVVVEVVVPTQAMQHGNDPSAVTVGAGEMANPGRNTGGIVR